MKRWLVFILLLTTIAGTFIPCCQAEDCPADKISSNTTHDDKQEGNCSPFFACTSCPGFVELSKPIQLAEPIMATTVHHESILKFYVSSYFATFWQPPRSY